MTTRRPPAKRARRAPPPDDVPAPPAAASLPRLTVVNAQLERMRAPARAFFAHLADRATLRTDVDGFLDLPVHPSLGASSGKRFETVDRAGRGAVVPLLSRELARTYMAAMLERCDQPLHNYLYIHGAQGVGKSYALYEAVCRLMARRDAVRVAYMHDCADWSTDVKLALAQMTAIVASAFHPDEEPTVWDACARVQTVDELYDVLATIVPTHCAHRRLKFLFVFDQHNGLSATQRQQLPWSMLEKELLAIDSWTRLGATVISASANNDYFLKIATQPEMGRVDCYTGFTDAEADCWRRRHRFFLGDGDGWTETKELLSSWPLELNALRKRTEPTLAARLAKLVDERLRILVLHEANHRRARLLEDAEKTDYAGIILDMLLARSGVGERYPSIGLLLNKQLAYYDEQTTLVRPIHELARRFYLTQGYLRPGGLLDETVKDVLGNRAATNDTKGRTVEAYVICCMQQLATFVLQAQPWHAAGRALGRPEAVIDAAALTLHRFGSQGVPGDIAWNRSLLLVPLNPNYPGVDLLLWDVRSRTLVGMQFTVRTRAHKMSFSPALEQAWCAASGATTFRFVWAARSTTSTAIRGGHYFVDLDALASLCAPLLRHYEAA
jgi:hypothetical protein